MERRLKVNGARIAELHGAMDQEPDYGVVNARASLRLSRVRAPVMSRRYAVSQDEKKSSPGNQWLVGSQSARNKVLGTVELLENVLTHVT